MRETNYKLMEDLQKELNKVNDWMRKGVTLISKDLERSQSNFNICAGHLNNIIMTIEKEVNKNKPAEVRVHKLFDTSKKKSSGVETETETKSDNPPANEDGKN